MSAGWAAPGRGRAAAAALRWAMRATLAANAALLALVALAYALPLPARAAGWSQVVTYRDGRPAHAFLSPDDKWRLPPDEVDPAFVRALVAIEDRRFWSHHGVDPLAIARAAWTDVVRGRRVSGGSTLSMQLARLLEPRPRTVPSKLLDMFRAFQLDLRLRKPALLAAYLARTPYGENVEGVEAAAWAYFGHGARHLTPVEIATLLAVPQGPARFAPSPARRDRLRARRDALLARLIAAGVFAGAEAEAALADARLGPPPDRLRPLPREAPHAATWLRARHPGEAVIRSTLDAGLQRVAERLVALRAEELRGRGIHNAAAVVVDHRTREVVALVGNLDAGDATHGGQLAMFDRPRSPGSTLKPLLYALAIDRGLALPDFLVADVPASYGGWRPRNFDQDWAGLVTLREALARSLNLPFVELLGQLGVEAFAAELARLGVGPARAAAGRLGLSLIVGGVEVTPLELAGIYATLAEDGVHLPLRLTRDAPAAAPRASFGPGAAWLTRAALALRDRPDFPRRAAATGLPPAIHWKTGTSVGLRDAWAAGSDAAYTAVVWTGNADLRPSADLVGSEAAAPLLFDLLEGVAAHAARRAPAPPPAELAEVELCELSGRVAGPACPRRVPGLAAVHAVPTAPCPYHQLVELDLATGEAVTPACRRPGAATAARPFVVFPSHVAAWLRSRHRELPPAPAYAPGCAPDAGAGPVIHDPAEGLVVTLLPGVPAARQVVALTAASTAPTLTWFVDGALVATAAAAERVYWAPRPGRHEVVVRDPAGRRARRVLEVRGAPGG